MCVGVSVCVKKTFSYKDLKHFGIHLKLEQVLIFKDLFERACVMLKIVFKIYKILRTVVSAEV